uniref:ribosomal RNA processing protein 1 homolog B-like n=1 Tax=Scatophagus argus TaxID=75038 RepID=UPI001ED7F7CD|nr:ribosomal RNA processing protein 1 homolog B-like [Scatophagus argus]
MASVQEPEVQFAQRLASNERPVRTKAMRKLRKYVSVRSQKATGGFTGDELLKLWKGLFYCLWMQDKPLLQEELSSQISGLIHCFQDVDGQFLYLESSLQTLKREWTGIDRLRMDKFFQLVRFMFRQTFELLRRRSWESSVVSRFLELLKAQILQAGSAAPSGLQIHILDLYMTELAAVGSAELTAEQNLIFIEPFCKTAAKTKDGTLFRSICSNIFSTIIDQAPFAIEDLMKELKAAEASDSDSGQVSEEDEEEEKHGEKKKSKPGNKRINGKKSNEEDEEDEDDELLHSEESDTEAPCDEDFGPVLQFDYAALADKLFELSSRSGTPSQNRKRLYRIVRVLRDLSEGSFPQDEYPEEVSTDEDDDMFGSRKRMKRRGGHVEEEEEDGAPASKKSKGKKKEASALGKQNKDSAKDEPADLTANNENKKKKKKRKKKKKKVQAGGENAQKSEQELMGAVADTEGAPQEALISVSSVKEGQSETLLLTEETSHPPICTTAHHDRSDKASDNGTKASELKPAVQQQTPAPDGSSGAAASEKKKKKKNKKGTKLQTDESQVSAEAEITPVPVPETEPTTPGRKKKMSQNGERKVEDESQANGVSVEEDGPATGREKPTSKKSKKKKPKADSQGEPEITSVAEGQSSDASTVPIEKKKETPEAPPAADESTETAQKKKKKKNRAESKTAAAESETSRMADDSEPVTTTTPAKKKKKKSLEDQTPVQEAKKKKRKIPVVFEFEADELQAATSINGLAEEEAVGKKTKLDSDVGVSATPLSTKKSQKKAKTSSALDFITFQSNAAVPTPLFCRTKGGPSTPLSSNKKSQTPKSESKKVTFGLKNNKTAEFRKSDRSLLVSPDGSSRVPFDPKQKPKSGVLKSPATPLSTKVKKTPVGSRKTSLSTPKSLPKRRPAAADFF